MRKALALLFVLACFPLSGCYSQETAAQGQLHKDKSGAYFFDFGQIKKGEQLKRSFKFTNETGKPLTISGINTSCGCTGSEIKESSLAPGQSTEVTVKFNSKGYNPGKVRQTLYIVTNNAKDSVIKVGVDIVVVE